MLGASKDPLRGGTIALLAGVVVAVTTRDPTAGCEAPPEGGGPAAEAPPCPEGTTLRVALLGGNPAMLGT